MTPFVLEDPSSSPSRLSQILQGALRRVPWPRARQPQAEWQTTSRRVYIVPTRSGIVYAVLMAALLVASINDRLNLGFALCFTLVGSGLAAMWQTQRNLRGLKLRVADVPDGVSGQALTIVLALDEEEGRPRFALHARWARERLGGQEAPEPVDLAAHGHATLPLRLTPRHRGRDRLPAVRLECRYPLGLFVCWTLWQPSQEAWIWPAPEQDPPPWPGQADAEPRQDEVRSPAAHTDDSCPDDIRPYRPGDRLRQIAWRHWARTDTLHTRDALPGQVGAAPCHFTLPADLPLERALSRLAAWCLQAEQAAQPWAIRELPAGTTPTPPQLGQAHLQAAMRVLAQWTGAPS